MGTSERSPAPESEEIATLKAFNAAQAARIAILEEQLRLAAVKAFAPKSEKLSALAQMDLFNEAETLAGASDAHSASAPDVHEITVPAHARARGKRKPIDAKLPRVRVAAKRASGTTSTTFPTLKRPAPAAASSRASVR